MNKIIIIAGGLMIALVLAMVLVWPQYQKLQVLNSDIKNKRAELQSQETYFSQVREISAKLQEYPDALSKISNALPKDPSLASLASFLQTNSTQTGLVLKKIVLGATAVPGENEGSLPETQLVVQVSGSYDSFKDFLSSIEDSARMIEVRSISVEIPSQESEEAPTFTLSLKTVSY